MQLPPLSLYIHLPWCERKCPYCDFNSHETRVVPEQEYVMALLRDFEEDLPLVQERTIETLFIGGGTPSLFSAASIDQLLRGIAARAPLAPGLEATMEANPGSAEAERFCGFREAGITRLSLGIQSFNDDQLRALGRIHTSDQAHAAIGFARDANFKSFNIDLMHGLPGQCLDSAGADLQAAIDYQPPHLSWYQLTIEPNTVFHNRPPLLPVEDALADIQQHGEQLLAAAGYSQYEVSAYSQPGRHCRHNLNYWSFGDYLGIGAGAHGKITCADGRIQRYSKTRQPEAYLAAKPSQLIARRQVLDDSDAIGEFMLNALRLNDGFTLPLFEARTGQSRAVLTAPLSSLYERGLLQQDGHRVTATSTGRRFLDNVIAEFFEQGPTD